MRFWKWLKREPIIVEVVRYIDPAEAKRRIMDAGRRDDYTAGWREFRAEMEQHARRCRCRCCCGGSR